MPKLTFQTEGKSILVKRGESILRAADRARIFISHKCGGKASCTTCRVRLLTPTSFTPPNRRELLRLTDDQLKQNIRLACQTLILTDGAIERTPSKLHEFISRQKIEDGVD